MRRTIPVIAIICLALIAGALYLAHLSPATGYELSIYAHTPTLVWVFLIASMTGGVTIIVHQAVTKGYKNSNFWLVGLLIIILTQVSLFYLPYIRGYVLWHGDTISHVGIMKDILITAHLDSQNFYPVSHTLLAEIIVLTGLPELTVLMLSAALPTVIYALSIYLLATTILPEKGQQLLAVAATASMPVILGMTPIHFSVLLITPLFFLYFKRSFQPYSILLLILLLLYPFTHVFSSLMLIIALVVIELSALAYKFIAKHGNSAISLPRNEHSLNQIMIESVILVTWLLSFQAFHKNLRMLWQQLITGTSPDVLGGMLATLGKINVHGTDFIILLFKMYGVEIIFIVLSLIAGVVLLKQIRSGDVTKEKHSLFALLSVFLFMGFLYLLYLLGLPGIQAIQPDRILYIVMVFTPAFVGFGLYELFKNARFRYLATTGIVCVIMLSSVLAILGLYDSPYKISPNIQITSMDMSGMSWFIRQKAVKIGCVDILNPIGRFAQGILGVTEARQRVDLDRGSYNSETIPDHFNYNNYGSLGESYTADRYSAITKRERLLYIELWEEVGRFNYDDFEKLELDTTVDKLYSNGELDVYFIHGVGSK